MAFRRHMVMVQPSHMEPAMHGLHKKASSILIVAICLFAAEVQACGELMLRSLSTMRYRAFVTRNPADILVYVGDASSKRPPATSARLHDGLERAGHRVSVVQGPAALEQALGSRNYDVIVAFSDDMISVVGQIAKATREPALIPVLDSAENEREMRERFPRLVIGNLNDLLRTIERAMKATGV